jgi:hypothetical protein
VAWKWGLLAVVAVALATTAIAGEMSFQDYLNKAMHKPGRTIKEFPEYTVIVTDNGLTYYIFTKPNHPAYPAVIIRKLVVENGATYMDTDGHSFASDADQPKFKAWMSEFSGPNSN